MLKPARCSILPRLRGPVLSVCFGFVFIFSPAPPSSYEPAWVIFGWDVTNSQFFSEKTFERLVVQTSAQDGKLRISEAPAAPAGDSLLPSVGASAAAESRRR